MKADMKVLQATWPWGEVRLRAIPGAANGLTLPTVQIRLAEVLLTQPEKLKHAQQGLERLSEVLGLAYTLKPMLDEAPVPPDELLLRVWLRLMGFALAKQDACLAPPVAGSPKWKRHEGLFMRQGHPQSGYLVLWPTHWPQVLAPALAWSLAQWNCMAHLDADKQLANHIETGKREWQRHCKDLLSQLPSGLNPSRLLTAAYTLRLPVQWLEQDILQIGHGRRARLLRSTLTDATSAIGVAVARDKVRTVRWLCQSGLPVPQHVEVADAEAAVAAAERLGWPVVVKPADQDRGDGARANLRTPEQVRVAFAHASSISKRVLVEQHITGHEYRLTVVDGELLWAHERVPASVTGDGQHTLQELIDAANARRRQALLADPYGWVPIQMDADNLSYLQENGRSLADLPRTGEVVRLQRVPAATTGGGGRAYFHTIHPDNRQLAERAAQLLRLDIAGVDLIMPDITRSWREVGGAVTEVNAIPQVSIQTDPTLAQRLLQKIMPHSGRIPLLFVLAEGGKPDWLDGVINGLSIAGLRVGLTSAEGLQIGDDWIRGPRTSLWDDIRAMQIDPSVGAMVIVSDGEALLRTGMPFDTVDALVVRAHRPPVVSLLSQFVRGVKLSVGHDWKILAGGAVSELTEVLVGALLKAEAKYALPEMTGGA